MERYGLMAVVPTLTALLLSYLKMDDAMDAMDAMNAAFSTQSFNILEAFNTYQYKI